MAPLETPAARRRRLWTRRCSLTTIIVLVALGGLSACTPEDPRAGYQPPQAGSPALALPELTERVIPQSALEVDVLRTASLSSGSQHQYQLDLPQGHAVLLQATQDQVDLVVEVTAPDGQTLLTIDRLGILAAERVCWISRQAGIYQIGIRPYRAGGRYAVRILHSRPATGEDRRCAEATRVFRLARSALEPEAQRAAFAEAARLWTLAGEPLGATGAWRELADALAEAGFLDRAIESFVTASAIAEAAGLVSLRVNLGAREGRALARAGQLDRAATILDQTVALARRAGDSRGEAATLTNRGLVDWQLGDPYRAQDRYRRALDLWRTMDDPLETAQALHNLGEALGTIDHHQEALDVLAEALELVRQEGAGRREAGVLAAIAWIHHLRGESQQGLEPLRQALSLRRADEDRWSEAGVLDRLGSLLLATGDRVAAEESYRRASSIAASLKDAEGYVATIRTNLGCMFAETDRHAEAAVLFLSALAVGQAGEQGDVGAYDRSHTDYCLARLARHRDDLDGALDHARKALDIVEALRERAREQGHRFRPIGLWQDYAALEVSLLLARYRSRGDAADLGRAFEVADQTRARRLVELVVATRSGAEMAANLRRDSRMSALQERLSALATKRQEAAAGPASGDSAVAEIEVEIRHLQLDLEDERATRRVAARSSGLLASPRPITVAEAQALLGPESVLLTYVLGAESSHLLTLTSRHLAVFDLPPQAVLEAHAEGLYAALKSTDQDNDQWLLIADQLGRMLLPESAIPSGTRHLLIIAQGVLHYLPFGVLPSPRAEGGDRGAAGPRLVLEDFEVVMVPSASVLAALRARREGRAQADKSVAVFADAVFSASDSRFLSGGLPANSPSAAAPRSLQPAAIAVPADRGVSIDRLPDGPLPRLPATAFEADAIGELVAADQQLQLRGWQATKQAVLAADLGAYRILHFATHAWVDERFPELSGLLLTRVDRAGREVDGGLYLHEIDSLHLASDLTVLSGCQTALGQRVRSDGLLGLTQGFFHAGSSQVLVSLWSVDDVAASLLMAEFYRQMLAHGRTPAAALRYAQRWLRAQDGYSAPRYWAPFVLQGDG